MALFSALAKKVRVRLDQKGLWASLVSIFWTFCYPFLRHHNRVIWEVFLDRPRSPSVWESGERFQVLGPENIDLAMTQELWEFLGGKQVVEELEGVRRGDRLFVVSKNGEYLYRAFVFFPETSERTRRQHRIIGETGNVPKGDYAWTSPAYRGRGLHRRVWNERCRYVQKCGYTRMVTETDTNNQAANKVVQATGFRVCREVSDWIFFRRFVISKVKDSARTHWRMFFV